MKQLKLALGSSSKSKIQAVKTVFEMVFEATPITIRAEEVPSGVAEAPHDRQTYQGALNRALALNCSNQEIAIGIESGIASRYDMTFEEAWAVILVGGKQYAGYSSGLLLPNKLIKLMKSGLTHDKAIKLLDSRSSREAKDTWAVYTNNRLSRQLSIEEAVRNAAVQIDGSLLSQRK